MTKKKVIAGKNLPLRFGLVHVVTYWFLWDKFQQEWVRTIIAMIAILHVVLWIFQLFAIQFVDIFEEKKNG